MSLTSRRTVMARKRYKPEESLNANGGSATEQQCHFVRALRSNGQERASGERHAVEDDQDPLQSPYAPKREPAQPAVEGDFAEDATHRESEGLREHLERRAIDINEPSLFSHDATGGGQQELERLAATPKKEPAQPAVEGDFAEDATHRESEGLHEHLERRAIEELERLAASVRVERQAVESDHDPLQSPYAPKKEPAQPAVEGDFAEDATHRESEGSREHLERRAIEEFERLAASVRVERHAVESDHDPLQSPYAPKKEPAQPAVEGDFAEDATHRESEGLHEHLERRAIEELGSVAHTADLQSQSDHGCHHLLQSPYAPKKEPAQP